MHYFGGMAKPRAFDVDRFKTLCSPGIPGNHIWYFDRLPSTNTYLKSTYLPALSNGLICMTDEQYSGKGQYNRFWSSSKNQNLTFTFVLRKTVHQNFHLLNLSVAGALCRYVQDSLQIQAQIKWPNDVLVDGKKIAGFLTEAAFIGKVTEKVLVGIGINVNQTEFDSKISGIATSLANIMGHEIDREAFMAGYMNHLQDVVDCWQRGCIDTVHLINQRMFYYGQWVSLTGTDDPEGSMYKLLGVDDDGFLRVLDENLNLRIFKGEQVRIHGVAEAY